MRDGRHVATVETAAVTIDEIISMMVGRTIYEEAPAACPSSADPTVVLEVRGLSRGRAVRDVSFQLRRGEILGVAGLVGAGRTELAGSSSVRTAGTPARSSSTASTVDIDSPATAVAYGISYLSEDRKRYGLALGLDVETNVALASYRRFLTRPGPGQHEAHAARSPSSASRSWASRRPASGRRRATCPAGPSRRWSSPSGSRPRRSILIFDEPTRGIDVGAKQEIYHLLNHARGRRASRSS